MGLLYLFIIFISIYIVLAASYRDDALLSRVFRSTSKMHERR